MQHEETKNLEEPKEVIIKVAFRPQDNGIGRDGDLPWGPIPRDMQEFVRETKNHTLGMGANTFWSIKPQYRDLTGREVFVVTRNLDGKHYPPHVKLVTSISEVITQATRSKVFLIGGTKIYQEAMDSGIAHSISATVVNHDDNIPCDKFFPKISSVHWQLVSSGIYIFDQQSELTIQHNRYISLKNPPPSER